MPFENHINNDSDSLEQEIPLEGFDKEVFGAAMEADSTADALEHASPAQMEIIMQMAKDPKTYLYALGAIVSGLTAHEAFLNIQEYIPSPDQYPEQVKNFRMFSAWALASSGIMMGHQYFRSKDRAMGKPDASFF